MSDPDNYCLNHLRGTVQDPQVHHPVPTLGFVIFHVQNLTHRYGEIQRKGRDLKIAFVEENKGGIPKWAPEVSQAMVHLQTFHTPLPRGWGLPVHLSHI